MSESENLGLGIIASKGTLDMAYPPLILASTAAAFGWDVMVFFTFWGLDVIHKEKDLMVVPVGNPNMGMPNAVGIVPGMTAMATKMMKGKIEKHGVADLDTLLDACVESGVQLMGCQMTMDLFGYEESDLVEGAEAGVGAATALERMADCDVTLFI